MENTRSPQQATGRLDPRVKLSTLWLFALLNYLYCDIVSLMDAEMLRQYLTGTVNGMEMTRGFLLGASVLMEIPIAMVLLSRVLGYRANRCANIVAGVIMTVVQSATLALGTPASYYLFCSTVEIAATACVVWSAWRWRSPAEA
jgi:hypothetical protein